MEKEVGPASLERVERCFAAPVPREKSHRRQEEATPAPVKAITCARSAIHLRQAPTFPLHDMEKVIAFDQSFSSKEKMLSVGFPK